MRKIFVLTAVVAFALILQGCAVYPPYGPAVGYNSYGGGHHHHRHHGGGGHGWHGGGRGWGGDRGWRGGGHGYH